MGGWQQLDYIELDDEGHALRAAGTQALISSKASRAAKVGEEGSGGWWGKVNQVLIDLMFLRPGA